MGALFYEPAALTTELWALARRIVPHAFTPGKRVFFSILLMGVTFPGNIYGVNNSYSPP